MPETDPADAYDGEEAPAPADDVSPELVDPELGGSAPFLQIAYEDADPITRKVMDAAKANTKIPEVEPEPQHPVESLTEEDVAGDEPAVPEGVGAPTDGPVGVDGDQVPQEPASDQDDPANGEFAVNRPDLPPPPQAFNVPADDTTGR